MGDVAVVLCGGATAQRTKKNDKVLCLRLQGREKNVTLKIEHLTEPLANEATSAGLDLLEIATYVYSADQAVRRDGTSLKLDQGPWYREFRLHIPVRNPALWNSPDVLARLSSLLEFLSDDHWTFVFSPLGARPGLPDYLGLDAREVAGLQPNHIDLFSGGLDSLAGAVQAVEANPEGTVLLSHVSTEKVGKVQRELVQGMRDRGCGKMLHIPVTINKKKALGKESTQRTRSFLFLALAAVLAEMLKVSSVRVWENGVVAWNLPISEQLVGARATRTAHPRALKEASALFTRVLSRPIRIVNPFVWKTRADIVKGLLAGKYRELSKLSVSCGKTWTRTKQHTHCGECSQCLDRRLGMLAAAASETDEPVEMYAMDMATQAPTSNEVLCLAEGVLRFSRVVPSMSKSDFFGAYPELLEGIRDVPDETPGGATQRLHRLFTEYGESVQLAIKRAIQANSDAMTRGEVNEHSLIGLSIMRGEVERPIGRRSPRPRRGQAARATENDETFQVLTHRGARLVGSSDYQRLKAQMNKCDLFVDLVSREMYLRGRGKCLNDATPTLTELSCLCDIAWSGSPVLPNRIPALKGAASATAAVKMAERARKLLECPKKGGEYRVIKVVARGTAGSKRFSFSPPPGFRYCLIRPA